MRTGQIIVLATPFFFLLIAVEFAVARWRASRTGGGPAYRLADAISSISLGMLSQLVSVFTKFLTIGIYSALFGALAIFPDAEFWTRWYGWLLALVFYDFCYYWLHRAGHEVALLWAAHVVHHQSQHYNLSTALRQTSSGALFSWIFFVPMALAGVPPLVFGVVALVDLLYQFWVHTEQIDRLGWFDRWFCAPSNHRVHHAVNDAYVDRNYGGILLVWDRLFGTYQEEREPCVYGTRSPLASWDPVWANAEVYWALAQDSWRARRWSDKLRVWLKPPGWRPADVAERFPKAPFDIALMRRFDPVVGGGIRIAATLQFIALLAGVMSFLWRADLMPWQPAVVWLAALTTALWAVGQALEARLTLLELLLIDAAILATAGAALGMDTIQWVFKPLAMMLAIGVVLQRFDFGFGCGIRTNTGDRAGCAFGGWLLAALVGSLIGDVLLMGPPRFFVPGLVCFLLVHVAYFRLFTFGVGLLPRPALLWASLAIGATMSAFLWLSGLPAALRLPVMLYVGWIAIMVAQAVGRAWVARDAAAFGVAFGACLFMLSDALLAIDHFVQPLPLAPLWVLGTYYAAQLLIVLRVRPIS